MTTKADVEVIDCLLLSIEDSIKMIREKLQRIREREEFRNER